MVDRGGWSIDYTGDFEEKMPSDASLEHIAQLVAQGFTSGDIFEDIKEDE